MSSPPDFPVSSIESFRHSKPQVYPEHVLSIPTYVTQTCPENISGVDTKHLPQKCPLHLFFPFLVFIIPFLLDIIFILKCSLFIVFLWRRNQSTMWFFAKQSFLAPAVGSRSGRPMLSIRLDDSETNISVIGGNLPRHFFKSRAYQAWGSWWTILGLSLLQFQASPSNISPRVPYDFNPIIGFV